jgi:hypothetical protein
MTEDKDFGIREELGENLRKDCASYILGRRILTYV